MAKAKHPDFGNQPTVTIDSTATQQISAGDGITLQSNVQDTSAVTSTTDSTRGSLSNISTTSIKQTDNRDDNSSAFDSSSDTECDDETITRAIERIPNELAPGETRMIQNGRLMLGTETINPGLQPPPTIGSIALQNSSDITFGNKTYIKGQVVIKNIYQDRLNGSANAGYQEHEKDAVETSSSKKEPPATLSSQAKSWQSSLKALIKDKPLLSSILIITLICFLSAGVAVICILTASGKTIFSPPIGDGDDDRVNVPPEKDIEGDIFPDPKPLRLVTRTEWLAQPPREVLTDLKLPVNNVIIAHTATEGCTTQPACRLRVRYLQLFHMDGKNYDDIIYNFLIGGDGNIYEGRGWKKIGAHTQGYNSKSIGIAFIGDYNYVDTPSEKQMELLQKILQFGVEKRHLGAKYKIYASEQLEPTAPTGKLLLLALRKLHQFVDKTQEHANKSIRSA
ncbi:peptidoglycan-recognition protein LC-like isoform X3 [Anopheles bellator]|uniref:peptidoglycan-recognition protein LC-like isoform X3 n=1 Tax=Anopheles bellator TaxID=139047 RepID=UPI0026492784|nr:peptidoglycan-recognition protein LC-like isoform X3 [Anopheles bellator]